MNEYIKQELMLRGFLCEVPVNYKNGIPADNRRMDFARKVGNRYVYLEVQFGNIARLDSDLLKQADAFAHGHSHLGIIVCPMYSTATMITGGCAYYEALVTRANAIHPSILQAPLTLVGLSHEGAKLVDLSQTQIPSPDLLSGNSGPAVSAFVVDALRKGVPLKDIVLPDHLRPLYEHRPAPVRLEEPQLSLL